MSEIPRNLLGTKSSPDYSGLLMIVPNDHDNDSNKLLLRLILNQVANSLQINKIPDNLE